MCNAQGCPVGVEVFAGNTQDASTVVEVVDPENPKRRYGQWHVQQRLKPLFAKDGKGKNRQWTFSTVMERLKALRRQRMKVGGVEFEQVAEPEEDQKEIIELLKAKKP